MDCRCVGRRPREGRSARRSRACTSDAGWEPGGRGSIRITGRWSGSGVSRRGPGRGTSPPLAIAGCWLDKRVRRGHTTKVNRYAMAPMNSSCATTVLNPPPSPLVAIVMIATREATVAMYSPKRLHPPRMNRDGRRALGIGAIRRTELWLPIPQISVLGDPRWGLGVS